MTSIHDADKAPDGVWNSNKAPEWRSKVGLSKIAHPLAGEKLQKKVFKLIKKAAKEKGIKRGVKEAVKTVRKHDGEKELGVLILAGNITPIDVITHIPILCEEKEVPYIYVPTKESLGEAGQTKRPTSCILIMKPKKDAAFYDLYKTVKEKIAKETPVW